VRNQRHRRNSPDHGRRRAAPNLSPDRRGSKGRERAGRACSPGGIDAEMAPAHHPRRSARLQRRACLRGIRGRHRQRDSHRAGLCRRHPAPRGDCRHREVRGITGTRESVVRCRSLFGAVMVTVRAGNSSETPASRVASTPEALSARSIGTMGRRLVCRRRRFRKSRKEKPRQHCGGADELFRVAFSIPGIERSTRRWWGSGD
jgi:hypothetical protein